MADRSEPWFKPKTHGYGAAPANWKGWAAVLGFVAFEIALALWLMVLPAAYPELGAPKVAMWLVAMVATTVAFVWICRTKTAGDWQWRTGAE